MSAISGYSEGFCLFVCFKIEDIAFRAPLSCLLNGNLKKKSHFGFNWYYYLCTAEVA